MDNLPNGNNAGNQIMTFFSDLVTGFAQGIKKNTLIAFDRLVGSRINIEVAKLSAKEKRIITASDADTLFQLRIAKAAADNVISDPQQLQRASDYYCDRIFTEQERREKVFKGALEAVKSEPDKTDTIEVIHEDWLEMFARVAETKSKEEIQLILSKILAGEIRKPGSFGARTIQLLSVLDQRTGDLFQKLCSISYAVRDDSGDYVEIGFVVEIQNKAPIGNPYVPYGIRYSDLLQLQDAGLIQSDLSTSLALNFTHFTDFDFFIGGEILRFEKGPDFIATKKLRSKVVLLTAAGLELRSVMTLSSNADYLRDFVELISKSLGLLRIENCTL